MNLRRKTTLLTAALAGSIIALLVTTNLIAFRYYTLSLAKDYVRTAAEVVRVSLTESMINGVIGQRESFLKRLAEVQGLLSAKVIRGSGVITQYGAGLQQEQLADPIESEVLRTGISYFHMIENADTSIFRGTIPFVADNRGVPNCLQCHQVANGTVLGAITITLSMTEMHHRALVTVGATSGLVAMIAVIFGFIFRRLFNPLITTTRGVQEVVARATEGDFTGQIHYLGHDEVGQIARDLNRLMQHLHDSLGKICRDVAKLLHYELPANPNLLITTTEMMKALVEVSQFKQSIEEDLAKKEVYARISRVLHQQFGLRRFTIYEAVSSRNQMKVMVVDDEPDGSCHWCDPRILFQADACRAQRTGRVIDSVDSSLICSLFLGSVEQEGMEHICLPVIHTGTVGSVVQLVMPRDHGRAVQMMLPFIQVYLRESAAVVEAKRLLDTLRETALRDPLTGLHNRRFLDEYLETLLAATQRKRHALSVLMMDLDHFKQVNDTFGHEGGDIVLKTIAKLIEQQVRSADLVIRYGGEEFLVILQEGDTYTGSKVAEKIRFTVESNSIHIPGGILRKTISIGVARYQADSDEFWEVVKMADAALYKAKADGRNRVITYTSEIASILGAV